jgi:hypothetical protein
MEFTPHRTMMQLTMGMILSPGTEFAVSLSDAFLRPMMKTFDAPFVTSALAIIRPRPVSGRVSKCIVSKALKLT